MRHTENENKMTQKNPTISTITLNATGSNNSRVHDCQTERQKARPDYMLSTEDTL